MQAILLPYDWAKEFGVYILLVRIGDNMCAFHMYVASCVPDGGIYHYVYENGRMQAVSKTAADRPMYLALRDNRLYAVLREPFADSTNSGVCSWDMDGDGNLCNQSEIISTGGRCGCHLMVDNEHIYVANYLSGSICMLPEGTVAIHSGMGKNPVRQEAPHVHFVGSTPDQMWLLAVDLGVDAIYMYSSDLQTSRRIQMPAGHGCRHLAWSEDGQYCFCVNELASSLSVLRYVQDELVLIDTISLLSGECRENNTAAAIRVTGERVYISIRGCDQIVMLSHHKGVLTKPILVDAEGKSPRDINIVGDFLFCANENSDCITAFRLTEDGPQSMNVRLPVPKPLCIVFSEK